MATIGKCLITLYILAFSLTASARAKTDNVRCDFTASIETTVEAGEFDLYTIVEDGEFRIYVNGEDGWAEVKLVEWMCET